MNGSAAIYPPSPPGIPPGLARPGPAYITYVVFVLVSLGIFLLVYLGLIAATVFLLWLLAAPLRQGWCADLGLVILPWIVAVVFALMLLVFLLKGLIRRSVPRRLYLEVREHEHPELFRFIRCLCHDTHAPLPRRVYLSHDVNAGVFYRESLLNLVLPVRKDLLIGLGLLNVLTLSEFKAVLAHEFGHFSQSSMKLGQYVYVVNPIIAHMVQARDGWDDLLIAWCSLPLPVISLYTLIPYAVIVGPGWLLFGLVALYRFFLDRLYRSINLGAMTLSREMEFNADLVAVSVTGSDALIHALARIRFAEEAFGQASRDLFAAADHRLFSRDLFFHQHRAAEFLRSMRKAPNLGLPPELPHDPTATVQVFRPDDGQELPAMWATHPPNYLRERNAKRQYIRSPRDERSPWILFNDPEAVRLQATRWFYSEVLGQPCPEGPLADPKQVQEFIDDEHAETLFDPKYHGLYDNRYIDPGDLDALVQLVSKYPWPEEQLVSTLAEIGAAEPPEFLEQYRYKQGEAERLDRLFREGLSLTDREFEFRGDRYHSGDLRRMLNQVNEELEKDRQRHFSAFDRKVFIAHCQMARALGQRGAEELVARYHCHLGIQAILQAVTGQHEQVQSVVALIATNQRVSIDDYEYVIGSLRYTHDAFHGALRAAGGLQLPCLKNLPAGETLGRFLLDPAIACEPVPDQGKLLGKWLQKFLGQLEVVRERAHRFHFKSLGGILAQQEQIATDWHKMTK